MTQPESRTPLVACYRITVFPKAGFEAGDFDALSDEVDEELHTALVEIARRLEAHHRVEVVAVDQRGAGWIAGGLGARRELGFDPTAVPRPAPPNRGEGR